MGEFHCERVVGAKNDLFGGHEIRVGLTCGQMKEAYDRREKDFLFERRKTLTLTSKETRRSKFRADRLAFSYRCNCVDLPRTECTRTDAVVGRVQVRIDPDRTSRARENAQDRGGFRRGK